MSQNHGNIVSGVKYSDKVVSRGVWWLLPLIFTVLFFSRCSPGFTNLWKIMMLCVESLVVKSGPNPSLVLRSKLKPTLTLQRLWSFTMRFVSPVEAGGWIPYFPTGREGNHIKYFRKTYEVIYEIKGHQVSPDWLLAVCLNSYILTGSKHRELAWWRAHRQWEGLLGDGCYGCI